MSATAGYDSAHRAHSENFADVSMNDETVTTQAKQLQREISRLQREIKTLSARRSRLVRADIAEMLSSDTSRLGEMTGQETSYIVLPSTASNKGEDRGKDRPSLPAVSGDKPISVCVHDYGNVNLPSGSEQPRETAVRNEAVRVSDPASRVSSG